MIVSTTDLLLAFICLLVAVFNASVGSTGGVTFAAMATLLPAPAIIPIHGLVEGISSAIRWRMLRGYVKPRFLGAFVAGGFLGFATGWPLIDQFSNSHIKLLLGIFLLLTVWLPLRFLKIPAAAGGAITSCLTLIVGATGPLVSAILMRHEPDHRVVIATQGACTTFQHGGKVLLFVLAGFSYAPYISLIILLSLAMIIGTVIGKHVLITTPEHVLRVTLKVIVTVLSVRLVLDGLGVSWLEIELGTWTGAALTLFCIVLGSYIGFEISSFKSKVKHFRKLKKKCGGKN